MCTIDGCDRKPVAKGLCALHYMRPRRTGDPNQIRKSGRRRDPAPTLMSGDRSPRSNPRWSRTPGDDHEAAEQATEAATCEWARERAECHIQPGTIKRTLLLLDDDPLICELFCDGLAEDFVV